MASTCANCDEPTRKRDNLYCTQCAKLVMQTLKDSDYLQALPPLTAPYNRNAPGPRECREGSGGWDNAVRAVEEG